MATKPMPLYNRVLSLLATAPDGLSASACHKALRTLPARPRPVPAAVVAVLSQLCRQGLVVRVRRGCYALAAVARHRSQGTVSSPTAQHPACAHRSA
jgi:Fe2+ or Zn2+ uptake regulation protein